VSRLKDITAGTRKFARRSLLLAVAALLLSAPASAVALSGPQLLTFDDYEVGTEISNQYEGRGILFKDEYGFFPEIRWDESAWTNPTLSGTFGFGSTIAAGFVAPGTTTPATVEGLSMDVGYINESGSTQLVVEHADGSYSIVVADEYGFDRLTAPESGISGFRLEAIGEEPAGFELDNLEYMVPEPPPPPAPAPSCPNFVIFDSRGSGETKGSVSNPAGKFKQGFEARLRALHAPSVTAIKTNRYPAVGVWSWNPLKPGERLNGVGAILGIHKLGAYKDSEQKGERAVESFVEGQVSSSCAQSGTKIVLLGYSQGAQATGNAYEQLSAKERRHVAAVVMWGDPLYNHANHPADRDRRDKDGLLGTRRGLPDGSKVFSYCNEHDPICQWPLPPYQYAWYRGKEHSLYYKSRPPEAENDGKEVASFLVKRG
jgi:hypothetical protein